MQLLGLGKSRINQIVGYSLLQSTLSGEFSVRQAQREVVKMKTQQLFVHFCKVGGQENFV
jgi:hypothetical protein